MTISRTVFQGLLIASLAAPIGLMATQDAAAGAATNLKCNGCVGPKDIGKKAVRKKHIKDNAVTSSAIKNGTIKQVDLAASAQVGEVRQILTGGFNQGASFANGFTAPGWNTVVQPTYPAAGEGEAATRIRMPAGTLKKLRVHVETATSPTGGSLIVMVRINGADTALTCTLTSDGDCTSNKSVTINDGDRFAIEVTSNLANEGNWTLNYSLQFM